MGSWIQQFGDQCRYRSDGPHLLFFNSEAMESNDTRDLRRDLAKRVLCILSRLYVHCLFLLTILCILLRYSKTRPSCGKTCTMGTSTNQILPLAWNAMADLILSIYAITLLYRLQLQSILKGGLCALIGLGVMRGTVFTCQRCYFIDSA